MKNSMRSCSTLQPAFLHAFCLLTMILLPAGLRAFADTPIVTDTSTVYTWQYAFAGCSGTCDLSPSYNQYIVGSPFSITKITFNWRNVGGNNCDNFGHYAAIISGNGNSSGTFAISSNNIYMGCGGSGDPGELDFTGQVVPFNFNLDFATVDGALQGGAAVNVTDVVIWGTALSPGVPAGQLGLPVLFVHGICDKPISFENAEGNVKTFLQQQLPWLYPELSPLPDEYVAFNDDGFVWFQALGTSTVQSSVDPRTRFFLVDFDSVNAAANSNYQAIDNDTGGVTQVSNLEKGEELASIISQIKQVTGVPRVIVVGHSMGGLDARVYIEGLASSTSSTSDRIPYAGDIAALVTLDTPHGGVQLATIDSYETFFAACAVNESIDKSEMLPSGTDSNGVQSIIPTLNFSSGNATPLPPSLSVTSIASSWTVPALPSPPFLGVGSDDILTSQEQDLASNLSNPSVNSQSTLIGDVNTFGLAEQVTAVPCGTLRPLHLLSCTGSAPQTYGILDPNVLASSVIVSGVLQVTPSEITVPPGATNVFFASSALSTVWSVLETGGGSVSATSAPGCSGAAATLGLYGCYSAPLDVGSSGAVFHIIATNASNPSQLAIVSIAVSPAVSQVSQSISFNWIPSPLEFGALPLTLNASATSGLSVTFSVLSGPATVNGNILTITGVGTVVVAADQAGNVTYAPAAEVTQSISVVPPPQGALFSQTDSSTTSQYSNREGNWYELGTGFSGLLTSLDIQCSVSDNGGSSVYLAEFSDPGYSILTNQYQLSGVNGNPSCAPQMARVHFANLSIPIWPTRYYELVTSASDLYADVYVLGTASEGVAIDVNWYYGTGIVYGTYTFYPFIISNGVIGSCTTSNPNPNPNPESFAAVDDFNGDCKSDILWRNSSTEQVYEWLMNGTTYPGSGTPGSPSSDWVIQGIGDFNGDGDADILWRNSTTGEVYIWLMNGTTFPSSGSLGYVSSDWSIAGVGDFNGDGKADILWRNSTTGQVYLWLMNGTAVAGGGSVSYVSSDWVIQGIGDFNGDGDADILWRNSTTGEVYIWLMNGATLTSSDNLGYVSSAWSIQGVGDFNGDGTSDILWQNSTTGQVYVWFISGGAMSGGGSVSYVSSGWRIQGVGDYDGSGRAGILWRNTTTEQVYIWLMNGTTLTSSGSPGTPDATWQMAP